MPWAWTARFSILGTAGCANETGAGCAGLYFLPFCGRAGRIAAAILLLLRCMLGPTSHLLQIRIPDAEHGHATAISAFHDKRRRNRR